VPESGELIGPYRLVSQLGKGAMGEVWRARDERLDRYVALKVLPTDAADDIERRARMVREAKAAAAIRHTNVVTLFDIVEHAGDDILVMELVEGRTLSEALRKDGAPELEVALRWIEGIADALVAAHGRGILHRDIKAANIMITNDGGVKVLDFGLAKLREGDAAFTSRPPVSRPPPSTSMNKIALDETMPSDTHVEQRPSALAATIGSAPVDRAIATGDLDQTAVVASMTVDVASYRTHAGQLLGTPLYMAPEQVAGNFPDERSEVFSVGVLAHEILRGKPPYTATSMDQLFRQITDTPPPPLPNVPERVVDVIARALEKNPTARYVSMREFRDAIAAERRRLFAPPARKWPLIAALAITLAGAGFAVWWWRAHRTPPASPGDTYVQRALEEYDVFYNEKALSSLRAALAAAPDHPRANAYMILFGASGGDRTTALAAAKRARPDTDDHSKDRALLDAAVALTESGPGAARAALAAAGAESDRELAFWTAELDYRAGNYTAAHDEYKLLLDEPTQQFRGRIYDHYSSVLLYLDEPNEALAIGKQYRDAFPGEADAVGVHATTLAAAGKLDDAVAAAEEALRLNEGEDTLAGLAKVLALKGERGRARELYQRSLDRANSARRPIRRAALALLMWIDGDVDAAKATVTPCLPGGADASTRERGACLFVAGVVDPSRAEVVEQELARLAADASAARPAYGSPTSLARLVRARARFFGGACVVDPKRPDAATTGAADPSDYDVPLDFYAAYHVPFFATWAVCEHAAALAARGDGRAAVDLLEQVSARAPNRTWIETAIKRYE
jgi:serine/threonine protein kinase